MPLQDLIAKSGELRDIAEQLRSIRIQEAELEKKLAEVRQDKQALRARIAELQSNVAQGQIDG